MWTSSNGRYSITDGSVTLVIPHSQYKGKVQEILDYLNRRYGSLSPSSNPRRICAACKMPILSHHKWWVGWEGRIRHRICTNPESY